MSSNATATSWRVDVLLIVGVSLFVAYRLWAVGSQSPPAASFCPDGSCVISLATAPKQADAPTDPPARAAQPGARQAPESEPDAARGVPLFDGNSLAGWKLTEFGGEGDVEFEDGALVLNFGGDLTGVTWDSDAAMFELPMENYEISLEAKRINGSDIFCGVTFPVGEQPCSLIIGGWGGGLVGLSSINGLDASENESPSYRELLNDRWHRVRLRVTEAAIEAWLDDERIIEVEREGREFSVRIDVELSRPLGFFTWRTTAALRNVRLVHLPATGAANNQAD